MATTLVIHPTLWKITTVTPPLSTLYTLNLNLCSASFLRACISLSWILSSCCLPLMSFFLGIVPSPYVTKYAELSSVYIYTHVCMYVCMYIRICVYTSTYISPSLYVTQYVALSSLYIWYIRYVCITYVCIRYVYLNVYVLICICIYVCMYIYTPTI